MAFLQGLVTVAAATAGDNRRNSQSTSYSGRSYRGDEQGSKTTTATRARSKTPNKVYRPDSDKSTGLSARERRNDAFVMHALGAGQARDAAKFKRQDGYGFKVARPGDKTTSAEKDIRNEVKVAGPKNKLADA